MWRLLCACVKQPRIEKDQLKQSCNWSSCESQLDVKFHARAYIVLRLP